MNQDLEVIKEIAKTTGQAIGAVEKFGTFVASVMGESIETSCGMLADSLKYKRWERQILLIEKAIQFSKNRLNGIEPKIIPPKFFIPLFNQASIEEDEKIHTIYAELLAAARDPQFKPIRSAYLGILQQMEPQEVIIIEAIFDSYILTRNKIISTFKWLNEESETTCFPLSTSEIVKDLKVKHKAFRISMDNLKRLGLIESYFEEDQVCIEDENYNIQGQAVRTYSTETVMKSHGGYHKICMTELGYNFLEACKYSNLTTNIINDESM